VIVGVVIGTLAIVAATIFLGWALDRKVRVTPEELRDADKPKPRIIPGETAATAIRANADQLARLRTQRCTDCRTELRAEDDHAELGGKPLVLLRFSCARCGTRRTVYVTAI
jgi:hypothetical protein